MMNIPFYAYPCQLLRNFTKNITKYFFDLFSRHKTHIEKYFPQ